MRMTMSEPARAAAAGRAAGRIVGGTLGLALVAATVAAAGWLPLPTVMTPPPSATIVPTPAAQQRLCPGPILRLGGTSGQDISTISSPAQANVSYSATRAVTQGTLAATDNVSHMLPVLVTLPAGGAGALAASQSQMVAAADLAGFAAAACLEPGNETWLVGGSTATGRTTLITLSNPSKVSATVDLSIFSERGRISAPGSTGIVVPAGSQRILPLAGFAPGAQSPVVHVLSRGGQIVANLQQSIVRTLDPGGIDIVAPASAPATSTVIPAIVLSNTSARLARASAPGYQDLQTVLRLFVPQTTVATTGAASVKATVHIIPEGVPAGVPAAGSSFSLSADTGRVLDVPLDIPVDGNYTVTVTADRPLVAAVRMSTVGSTGATDFAWAAGASALTAPVQLSIASGPSPELHLANPGSTPVTLQLASAAGSRAVPVPADGTVVVPVTSGAGYTLTGFGSLRAAVSYLGDGTVSGFALYPSRPAAEAVTVYP